VKENAVKKVCLVGLLAVAMMGILAGCDRKAGDASGGAKGGKKFYWVQFMRGHPVHQLTQIAFKAGCEKLGYSCEIVGTDGADISGTIALGEQALARGDAAGMVIWTSSPAYDPFIRKVSKAGVPVILPHIPPPDPPAEGATGYISCDTRQYAADCAMEIAKAVGGKGIVALTQGSFNTIENTVAETFAKTIKENFPDITVLTAEEEGFEPSVAITKATVIMQRSPDLKAAFSTTGGGPSAWAGAQKDTGRRIVAIGMDYTRVNLDLVRDGKIYAVVGQPLWEESYGAAELLDRVAKGEKIPVWTKLPAPIITREKLGPYYELIAKVESAIAK
jgi:ribose transport system substrate-binding protein